MSLRLKTILGIAAIEAVLLIVLISSVVNYMKKTSEQDLINYADTIVRLFSTATKDAIISLDLASLESFTTEILENKGVLYARIIGPNNTILAQSGSENLLDRQFFADTSLEDITDNVFDHSIEVAEGGANYGRVEIGISTNQIQEKLKKVIKYSSFIAITEMLLVAVFSFFLGLYLTRQLRHLRIATKKIAAGNLRHQVPIKGSDELSEVASSFNLMVEALRISDLEKEKYYNELTQLNEDLENRIERRTLQLSLKNKELEKAYKTLKSTQIKLLQSEKMASLGQMAAGVAHEINNPMAFVKSNFSMVKNYLSIYDKCIEDSEKMIAAIKNSDNQAAIDLIGKIEKYKEDEDLEYIQDDIVNLIKESIDGIDRVSNISQDLKNFSRIDQAERTPTNINTCITETLKILPKHIKDKCNFHLNLKPLPLTLCNPGKLNQVLLNLIRNAEQAIQNSGSITINTQEKDSCIEISIVDTGKGISQENLSRIFDPFYTTKEVGEGTGLGLSISHGIIEEHDGTIEVQSEEKRGTKFLIRLPLAQSDHTSTAAM